jgi:hypothetical protein
MNTPIFSKFYSAVIFIVIPKKGNKVEFFFKLLAFFFCPRHWQLHRNKALINISVAMCYGSRMALWFRCKSPRFCFPVGIRMFCFHSALTAAIICQQYKDGLIMFPSQSLNFQKGELNWLDKSSVA